MKLSAILFNLRKDLTLYYDARSQKCPRISESAKEKDNAPLGHIMNYLCAYEVWLDKQYTSGAQERLVVFNNIIKKDIAIFVKLINHAKEEEKKL